MIRTHSSGTGVTGARPPGGRRLASLLAALLLQPVLAAGFSGGAAAGGPAAQAAPASQPRAGQAGMRKVTIESAQQRQALRRQVNRFVAAVIARHGNESLVRWNEPVCPLVAGLPRDFGEFILARISQAARAAGVPLAGTSCRANLFVVVTEHPDLVLKRWLARDPRIETRNGIEPVRSLLESAQPVRVWYNTVASCNGAYSSGTVAAAELNATMSSSNPSGTLGPSYCQNGIDTHLSYGDVRSIYSVIAFVDANELKRVTIGQLADYLSLVGLVSIRPGTDGEGVPTILRLFRDPNPPQGLTPWDQALIYSLYNTNQSGKLQLVDMESTMASRLAP
jgi:hypothetical protein